MVTTKTRSKVGTTEYVATARQIIPLADPNAWGNFGLEGHDEDYHRSSPFVDLAGAEAWMRWAFASLPHVQSVEIDRVEWQADEFYDDRYGQVYDAIEENTRRWTWYLSDDGPELDEECDPR